MKKPTKPTKTYLKRKADVLFSKIIRKVGFCEKCGVVKPPKELQCSHIIGRRNLHLRFDLQNALALCYKDHIHWWHKEPLQASKWFQEHYPERYEYLMKEKNVIEKPFDYEAKIKDLKEYL